MRVVQLVRLGPVSLQGIGPGADASLDETDEVVWNGDVLSGE